MAGWSILINGFTLDRVENIGNYQGDNGCCLGVVDPVKVENNDVLDINECEDRLRSLFDRIFSVFIHEAESRDCFKPFPVMLGNEESPDMLKLFLAVRERGGFDLVSKDGLWGFVAEELGFDCRLLPSVKLVYFKYLKELEEWSWSRSRSRRSRIGGVEVGEDSRLVLLELENEFRDLLTKTGGDFVNVKEVPLVDYEDKHKPKHKHKHNFFDKDFKESSIRYRRCDNDDEDDDKDDKFFEDNEKGSYDQITDHSYTTKLLGSHKRKRECLSNMLKWLKHIAKCPKDSSVGAIPSSSVWKEVRSDEYWAQVIRARDVLLERKDVDSNTREPQSNQRINPCMYDDYPQSTERLRYTNKLLASEKSQSLSSCCSGSCSPSQTKPPKTKPNQKSKNNSKEPSPEDDDNDDVDFLASYTSKGQSGDFPRRYVSVGSHSQANVPKWTGVVSDTNSKWLGTCVWPFERPVTERHVIGTGRPDSCSCCFPGSVECVRFHVAEARMRLKLSLGSVFYRWRFDRMGEEVSLRWSVGEENMFKNMVTLNRLSLSVSFWDSASKCFKGKTRQDLVSYYLNVFVIQRRSYQNRVTPDRIDSDDDETPCGSVGYGFGHDAVTVPHSKWVVCSQNGQCFDFD